MTDVGSRVGAMASSSEKEVHLFGYGVYVGDEVPPQEVTGPFGKLSFPNPKIVLDSGDVVWGCECWWGPEEKIKTHVGNRKVVMITPKEYRAQVPQD